MILIDADKLKHVIHCAYSDDLEILERLTSRRQLLMRTRLLNRLNIEEQILIVNYVNTMMMKKQYVVKIVQMHLLMI